MQPIEIRTAKSYWWRMGCVGAIFVGCGLPFVVGGIRALFHPPPYGGGPRQLLIQLVLVPLIFWGVPLAILALSRRGWVHHLDREGVTLRSGRRLAWSDFEAVKEIRAKGTGPINHYELRFRGGGRGCIYDQVIENVNEALAIVWALQRGANPFLDAPVGPGNKNDSGDHQP